jgi:Ni,Fe-hydrogenase III small subunit/ferredoxin
MPWVPRGLREGIVTSRYPRRRDGYGEGFRSTVGVGAGGEGDHRAATVTQVCPTDAISVEAGQLRLDRGRCILCGRCTELWPEKFRFDPDFETSSVRRGHLVVPDIGEDDAALALAQSDLARRVKALRRSVHIRHVDAGSDGAEEWEVAALTNPVYDVQRLGIFFTASPRHADLLLVTGVGTAGMLGALGRTFEAMPEPKVVIAAGVDAISGGLIGRGYAARGGVAGLLPVDVFVPGSPPSPFGLLHGILLAVGLLREVRPE